MGREDLGLSMGQEVLPPSPYRNVIQAEQPSRFEIFPTRVLSGQS